MNRDLRDESKMDLTPLETTYSFLRRRLYNCKLYSTKSKRNLRVSLSRDGKIRPVTCLVPTKIRRVQTIINVCEKVCLTGESFIPKGKTHLNAISPQELIPYLSGGARIFIHPFQHFLKKHKKIKMPLDEGIGLGSTRNAWEWEMKPIDNFSVFYYNPTPSSLHFLFEWIDRHYIPQYIPELSHGTWIECISSLRFLVPFFTDAPLFTFIGVNR